MSMNTYIVHEIAFYFDEKVRAFLTRAMNLASGLNYEFDNDPEFYEKVMRGEIPEDYLLDPSDVATSFEDATYFNEFEGHVSTIDECKEAKHVVDCHISIEGKMLVDGHRIQEPVSSPMDEKLEDDGIAILYLDQEPSLFKQAYSSIDEIIDEVREKLGDDAKEIPEEYDLRRNICLVSGTYFC